MEGIENKAMEQNTPAPKEKLRSIMDAANALTALGDDESVENPTSNSVKDNSEEASDNKAGVDETRTPKRFLPEHKKPDAAPTFPEKLMSLMRFAEKQDDNFCVAWCDDGRSFVIRQPEDFARLVVPKFFKPTKFSSFTRKLYRWGFRQINRGIGPDDPIIFGNEFFIKDKPELMASMRSITAASARKVEERGRSVMMSSGTKHEYEGVYEEVPQKRMMFDYPKQSLTPMYSGMSANGTMPLTNALRSGFGPSSQVMMPLGAPTMMSPYEFMNGPHGNSMISQFVPANTYPSPQTTAEIVNAAIAALRYAS